LAQMRNDHPEGVRSLTRPKHTVLALWLLLAVPLISFSCSGDSLPPESIARPADPEPQTSPPVPEAPPDQPPALTMTTPKEDPVALSVLGWTQGDSIPALSAEDLAVPYTAPSLPATGSSRVSFILAEGTPVPAAATLKVWPLRELRDALAAGRPWPDPVAREELTLTQEEGSPPPFTWRVPQLDSEEPGDVRHVLQVTVTWEDGWRGTARYHGCLQYGDTLVEAHLRQAARSVFRALWKGDEDALPELIVGPWPPEGPVSKEGDVLGVTLASHPDLILWRAEGCRFTLLEEPRFIEPPHTNGVNGVAGARVEYTVQVMEADRPSPYRCDFQEEYRLCERGEGAWLLAGLGRRGMPWQATGGTELGWAVEGTPLPGAIEVGPFKELREWWGWGWSDDRRLFAFVGVNGDRRELWTVHRTDTEPARLLSFCEPTPGSTLLHFLGWAPGRDAVRFLFAGTQSSGSHAGEDGCLIGEVSYPTAQVHELAFIPLRCANLGAMEPGLAVTADRTNVFLWDRDCEKEVADLWRVDLSNGEKTCLFSDLTGFDGPEFPLLYSPSGWYAVDRWEVDCKRTLTLYDLKTGRRCHTKMPSGDEMAVLAGWTPGDLVAVALSQRGELAGGAWGPSWWVSRSIHFYDTHGELRGELRTPGDDPLDRIGDSAWREDGSLMAFVTGRVATDGDPRLQAESLWTWEGPGSQPVKLTDLPSHPDWDCRLWWAGGEVIKVLWYGWDSKVEGHVWKAGVRVSLDGTATTLTQLPARFTFDDPVAGGSPPAVEVVSPSDRGPQRYYLRIGLDGP